MKFTKYSNLIQPENDFAVSFFIKSLRYSQKMFTKFKAFVKRLIYVMRDWQELAKTEVSKLKTGLIWAYKIILAGGVK